MYPTQVIENFLSPQLLAAIAHDVSHYDSSHDVVPAPIGRYLGVSQSVTEHLTNVIDCLPGEQLFIRILDATLPGGPHADNGLPTPLPPGYHVPNFARTFILPLQDQDTHTIVFNQAMPLGVGICEHMMSLPPLAVSEAVGQETGQRYLSHTGRDWLDRLSIDVIFPWRAGDLLIFDRSRIHCSDNWLKKGMTAKQGFVIWSEIQ